MRNFVGIVALAGLALAGCNKPASEATAAATSALTGQLQQATFPTTVTAVEVVNDQGSAKTVAVGATGNFAVDLQQGGVYRFFLAAGTAKLPVALRNLDGRLETKLSIQSSGATVYVGKISFRGAGQSVDAGGGPGSGGDASVDCSADGETNEGADCVDGLDAQTHQPCDGGPQAAQNDGEQPDESTASASSDGDGEQSDAGEADPANDMAVAELSVNADVVCSEGDSNESDGETAD